jgi:hypothetical protein
MKYIRHRPLLTSAEWPEVLHAFDLLRDSRMTYQRRIQTFRQFYETVVDRHYGTAFLAELRTLEEVEKEGMRRAQERARQILRDLTGRGLREPLGEEERLLVAFCLYWWNSFSKGYVAEIAIFRDLEESGIPFVAHDLDRVGGRFTPVDLTVRGQSGDIKSSTYFLQTARSFPLHHAFYIARLFNERERRWYRVVFLQEWAWEGIDGETVPTDWLAIPGVFPQAALITVHGTRLVVIEYEVWKRKVLAGQRREEDPHE